MPPVQLFFLCSALLILPLAWVKGGHPERAGVALLIGAYVSGPFLQGYQIGDVMVAVAVCDLVVWSVFVGLALRYDRWWLLLASGAQSLNVLSHAAILLTPDLSTREAVAAQWVFGLVSLYALFSGILERHLSGERAASPALSRTPVPQT